MKHTIWILASIFLVGACQQESTTLQGNRDSISAETVLLSEEQYRAIHPRLANLQRRKMPTRLRVNGMLDVPPQNLVTISAPMAGFVKSTKLLQGMKVKKGEVIAVLEHQDYIQLQQDYLDNSSKLKFLESEHKRQASLALENVNSQKAYEQSKSNYESAKAQVNGLAAKLKMLNIDAAALSGDRIASEISIYSPIAGFVTEVNVNIGGFVDSAHPMFRIVDVKHLHAEVQVYEKDVHRVRVGQTVEFHLPGELSPRTASVFLVGKEITADRTVRVHCHLDREDEALLPGMFIEGMIEVASAEVEAVPAEAVISVDGSHAVFVRRGNHRFQLVSVTTGATVDGFAPIQPGHALNRTDSIVIEGNFEMLGLLKNMGDE